MTNTGDKLDFMQISIRLARWQQNFSFCLPYIRIFWSNQFVDVFIT